MTRLRPGLVLVGGIALSAHLKAPPPPAATAIQLPRFDKELVKTGFLEFLDFALQFPPSGPEEQAIRARLARIAIGAGKTFDFKDLSVEHRAAAAKPGICGNDAAEATYPATRADADGDPLDGSKHACTITFAPGQLPPVNAFWSITMYDGKTQLLIENQVDRYLVNSPMLPSLKKGKDGSATLQVHNGSPGKNKESNWLPAPAGPISLVMRLCWPRTEPPSVLPPGEGTWRPPGVVRVP